MAAAGRFEMASQVAALHGLETGNTNNTRSAAASNGALAAWWPATVELVPGVSTRVKSRRKPHGR